MIDPLTALRIASLAVTCVKAYFEQEHKEELKRQNELLQNKIDVEIKLYKNSLVLKLDKARSHFRDALFATNDFQKTQYLTEAKSIFTELINLPEKEDLNGHCIDNTSLICCGYYGRFQVFGMLSDYKNGTRQVYECAIKYPADAVSLFDNSFFPSIDVSSLTELCDNLTRIRNWKPLTGIYADIPSNMAKPLIERQLQKYIESFKQILNTI